MGNLLRAAVVTVALVPVVLLWNGLTPWETAIAVVYSFSAASLALAIWGPE